MSDLKTTNPDTKLVRGLYAHPIVERGDGMFEIGFSDPSGPFQTRRFAEAVASREVRHVASS
jgi:hypothetical protein